MFTPTRLALTLATATVALASGDAFAQTCLNTKKAVWAKWFAANELVGGHVKTCHVAKTAVGLIGRMTGRGGQKGDVCKDGGASASSFTDVSAALVAIKAAIAADGAAVQIWFDGAETANHVVSGTAAATVGTIVSAYEGKKGKNRSACAKNASYVCASTKSFKVVFKKSGADCLVVTAYPSK